MRIYYEIETLKRELDARIFFAVIAATRGYSTVLGKKNRLLDKIKYLSPGIFIFKSNRVNPQKYSKEMRKLGYYIFSSDEEGLISHSKETTLSRNPIDAFETIDKYLAWGNEQKKILKDEYKEKIENKLIICGNSRMDITKKPINQIYLKSSEVIKKKYGEFDLYISSFHRYNALGNLNSWEKILSRGSFANKEIEEAEYNIFHLQKKNMNATIKFLNLNSKKFKNKIIIKPHPSEDISTWKNKLNEDLKESVIIDHKNTNSWILAAKNVFSFYSTSLIETFLLGKIPYNLKFYDGKYYLNQDLFECCENIINPIDYQDLMTRVENSNKNFSFEDKKHNIFNSIHNLNKFNPDIICDEIDKMFENKKCKLKKDKFTNKFCFKYFQTTLKLKNFLNKKNTFDSKIYNQKNPGITKEVIIDKMILIGKILNIKDLKCNELYPGVFEITKVKSN